MFGTREKVIEEIRETFLLEGVEFEESMLQQGVMDIGVDSLTYAVLVARLEQNLGIDPFTDNPDLGYPTLLIDFVNAYLD